MKRITMFLALTLGMGLSSFAAFGGLGYEVTQTTFSATALTVSTGTPVLVSLSPAKANGLIMYSTSLFNITSSSVAYTLSASSTSSGSPALSCANGPLIGSGTETAPTSITEKFEGLYMWAVSCGNAGITMRRVIRGR